MNGLVTRPQLDDGCSNSSETGPDQSEYRSGRKIEGGDFASRNFNHGIGRTVEKEKGDQPSGNEHLPAHFVNKVADQFP